ncbi:MAG: hypothetical protein KUL77_01060 [Thermomonas sp.]|jgi:hypothetical protein|uniref:putative metalloprotease CJM1_0395 family protein n=1 Tax=Thermomonas sp. TaxID=1971895 RepID=UPI001ECB5DAC|nr:putative metalloprotease CJM1_0395 family protein [Thermomonas sp.]MBV2208139.1 hypothetical protein [Thermomonas sp.]
MPVSNINASTTPWVQLRPPAQGVVAVTQSAPDVQTVSQTTRPALPPTQSYPNSDSLFARQREHEQLARSNESKADETAKGQDGAHASAARKPQQQAIGALTADQLVLVNQLKARDTEVRQHEAAHQAAGGSYTGAASFSFTHGPDGKNYAIGGEVSVDKSPIPGRPEETIAKMRVIQQAALAPADPSPQDRRVAADAARMMLQAQSELLQQQEEARTRAAETRDLDHQQRQLNAANTYFKVAMADTPQEPHSGALFALSA